MGYMTYNQSLQQTRFTQASFLMGRARAAEFQRYVFRSVWLKILEGRSISGRVYHGNN